MGDIPPPPPTHTPSMKPTAFTYYPRTQAPAFFGYANKKLSFTFVQLKRGPGNEATYIHVHVCYKLHMHINSCTYMYVAHINVHVLNMYVCLTNVVTNGHLMDAGLRVFDRLLCFHDLRDKSTCTYGIAAVIRGPSPLTYFSNC